MVEKEKEEIKTSFLSIAPILFLVFLILPFLISRPVNFNVRERDKVPRNNGGCILRKLGESKLGDVRISKEEQECFRKQLASRITPPAEDLRRQRLMLKTLREEIEKSDPFEELKSAKSDPLNRSRAIIEIVSRQRRLTIGLMGLDNSIRESIKKRPPADSGAFVEILKDCDVLLASQEVILQKVIPEYYKDIVENLKTKKALEQKIKLCEKDSPNPSESSREVKKLCLEALQKMKEQER